MTSIDRSAIIVVRGWIPAQYRDKRSRPQEVSQNKRLVKITGTWLKGKDIHDYSVPNNPDNNEWHNLALEDIGLFWDLPNFDEAKFYYFRAIHMDNEKIGAKLECETPARADTVDELVDYYYGWRMNEYANRGLMYTFGAASSMSFAVFVASLM